MKYLISHNSFTLPLAASYHAAYQKQNHILFNYVDLFSQLLNQEQCKYIFNKVYLSEDKPFGLIDENCVVGKVATSKDDVHGFNTRIKKALDYIEEMPELNLLVKKLIKCFVPVVKAGNRNLRENGNGSSVHWLKGAVFLSLPSESPHAHLELILNIVHELGHQSLMLYQDCDEIIYEGLTTQVYSSIRKTYRPSLMSLHALVAVHYMLEVFKNKEQNGFWKKLNEFEVSYLNIREQELRVSFVAGSEALKRSKWTSLGKTIYTEMIQSYLSQYHSHESRKMA